MTSPPTASTPNPLLLPLPLPRPLSLKRQRVLDFKAGGAGLIESICPHDGRFVAVCSPAGCGAKTVFRVFFSLLPSFFPSFFFVS